MINKQFINNLSATYADVRKLDVKKINLKGKNILEYIKDSEFNSYDTRDPQLKNDELDVWNTEISLSKEGHIEVKPHVHSVLYVEDTDETTLEGVTESQIETLNTAVKVIDNKVLGANDEHIMYWQTDGLTIVNSMFVGCTNLTTFSSDLSSLTAGYSMFEDCSKLTSFSSDLSSLTRGNDMFYNCTNLTTFISDLSSLTNGTSMFYNCTNLTSFNGDLSSLTNGGGMFHNCSNLTSFSSDLSSLTTGYCMFKSCTNLESFTSDLSSLTSGYSMFEDCSELTSFSSDVPNLTNGTWMFSDCENLTSFRGDLSSLTNGDYMFDGCKLDAQSVTNIIHFIPQRDTKPTSTTDDGNIAIGIGIVNTDAAKQAFAEECYCDTWEELNKDFDDKNWGVQWQFNGPASYSLRDPRPSTAVYTKLEEVFMPTEEEIAAAKEKGERITIPTYEYTSQDGDNYYNIHWYHDSNTNNEGYDYFESLEMATLAYSVIPKENIISTEE